MLSPNASALSFRVAIFCSCGRSTEMALVAGQYDTGSLGRALVHDGLSKRSWGGLAGENRMPNASMTAFTESSVTGQSPD